MKHAFALIAGLIFGLGLLLSRMTDPSRIKGFLDVAGAWNPSLALVMGGAVAVGSLAFALARARPRTWSGDAITLPSNRSIDARLIGGGLIFGLGWGVAGFCPGPALVSASAGSIAAAVFVLAMLVGMTLHDRFIARA